MILTLGIFLGVSIIFNLILIKGISEKKKFLKSNILRLEMPKRTRATIIELFK